MRILVILASLTLAGSTMTASASPERATPAEASVAGLVTSHVHPIAPPRALVRERAACTTLQRCKDALERAYAGAEWSRKARLHQRSLPASNLTPVEVGRELALRHGWSGPEFACLYQLWNRESGWQIHDRNWSSEADGIPQANPASKMAAAGADYRTNPATQIRWGLSYVKARYGSPCAAWAHSNAYGYY